MPKPSRSADQDFLPGRPQAARLSARPVPVIALLVLGYSGYIKSSPFLDWLIVDLTLLSALVVLISVVVAALSGRRAGAGFAAVALLWGAWLPGVAISVASRSDDTKAMLLFTVTALCAFAPFYLVTNPLSEKLWVSGHVVVAAVFTVALLLFPSEALNDVYADRLSLEGGNTISAARLVGAGVLIAFLRALMAGRARSRIVWWAVTVGGSLVIAAIGSRGPFVALVAAGLATVLLSIVFTGRRLRVVTWSAVAIGGLLLFVFEQGDALGERFTLLLGQGGDEARRWLYRTALRSIEENPFGIGWGGFGRLPSVSSVVGGGGAYPHNLFLEVFVEGGVVAGVALIVFIGFTLVRIRRVSVDATGTAVFALAIYWLLAAQTSSDINANRMTWVALAVGLAVWGSRDAAVVAPAPTRVED